MEFEKADVAFNMNRLAFAGDVSVGISYMHLLTNRVREMNTKQGVQIEECVVSMKNYAWGTEDLLPGVKVKAGAVGRIIQLTQAGYI